MNQAIYQQVDSVFFRDGSPFNSDELQSNIQTLFPPSPMTLVGTLRAALARDMGWDGRSEWSDQVKNELGSFNESLGKLNCVGPTLIHAGEPVFPAPFHLLGIKSKTDQSTPPTKMAFLKPATTGRRCDLGDNVRLPELQTKCPGSEPLGDQWWVNANELAAVLNGNPPKCSGMVHQSQLWEFEQRIGIKRNTGTRTTDERAMYAPKHVRLQPKTELSMFFDGISTTAKTAKQLSPIGGESRSCWLDVKSSLATESIPEGPILPIPSPKKEDILDQDNIVRYCVIVLTPIRCDSLPRWNQPLSDLPGKLISACTPRPIFYGGWDSPSRSPLTLKPHVAPGSVFFFECKDACDPGEVIEKHLQQIGDKTEWGFGLIAIGKWPS